MSPQVPDETPLEAPELLGWYAQRPLDGEIWQAIFVALASPSEAAQRNAAFLLRKAASDQALPEELTLQLSGALANVQEFKARLYLCQAVASHFDALHPEPDAAAAFLRNARESSDPPTRAWAITATVELARRHPKFQLEAFGATRIGARDPVKLVRDRIAKLDASPKRGSSRTS
ncbi:MAG: hypothetical protein ACFB21_10670 [Opitutales bacterium]